MGLAYSVSSALLDLQESRDIRIRNPDEDREHEEGDRRLLRRIDRFKKDGRQRRSSLNARSYIYWEPPFMTETVSKKAGAITTGIFYGMGPDLVFEDIDKIRG